MIREIRVTERDARSFRRQVGRPNGAKGKGGLCWPWIGRRNAAGYGVFDTFLDGDRMAHRVAWVIEHGPILDGLFVCHSCDNPRCVRPSHLWLGTHSDNMRDMAAKGRGHKTQERRRSRKPLGGIGMSLLMQMTAAD